jgi:hypothetical protein
MIKHSYRSKTNPDRGYASDPYSGKRERPVGVPHPLDQLQRSRPLRPPTAAPRAEEIPKP